MANTARHQFREGILNAEKMNIKHCCFEDLIGEEALILTGIGQILKELSENGDSINKFEHVDVSARSLWTLGELVDRTMAEVNRKLDQASKQLQKAEIPEKLGAERPPAWAMAPGQARGKGSPEKAA